MGPRFFFLAEGLTRRPRRHLPPLSIAGSSPPHLQTPYREPSTRSLRRFPRCILSPGEVSSTPMLAVLALRSMVSNKSSSSSSSRVDLPDRRTPSPLASWDTNRRAFSSSQCSRNSLVTPANSLSNSNSNNPSFNNSLRATQASSSNSLCNNSTPDSKAVGCRLCHRSLKRSSSSSANSRHHRYLRQQRHHPVAAVSRYPM